MTAGRFRRVAERDVHRGYLVHLVVATVEAPDGTTFERDVVRTPDAVGVVAVDRGADGTWDVVLVRQYRAAVDDWVLELPAGMRDVDGEPVDETARRELEEEAGLVPGRIEPLGAIHPAPGFTTHRTDLVLATELTATERRADGIEEESMTVERLSLADAVALVASGTITDATTSVGLLLARDRLEG
ncbi:MAG TPA: NUDIX hydrolase [Acidimicrobiales bacterium]|nr:NUDIX hydrolase [Acidimicrobiales bacterium]